MPTTLRAGVSGRVYVYMRDAGGVWVESQVLNPSERANGFGQSIALDRSVLLVGAPEGASFESMLLLFLCIVC